MAKKDKLHALLAVEGDLKSNAEAILKESISTFKNKKDHFVYKHKSYTPTIDGGMEFPAEEKAMVTTVDDKLKYTQKSLVKAIDAIFQKESTNSVAKADLVVDGEVLAEGVPATALLNLESRLKSIRALYHSIPTLPPEHPWIVEDKDRGVYKTDPDVKIKHEKQLDAKVLYPATEQHPAQVEKIHKDVPIGKWVTVTKSSLWTSQKKSDALEKIDNLIRSVKKARQRANDVEVEKVTIGKKLFDYVHNGLHTV